MKVKIFIARDGLVATDQGKVSLEEAVNNWLKDRLPTDIRQILQSSSIAVSSNAYSREEHAMITFYYDGDSDDE